MKQKGNVRFYFGMVLIILGAFLILNQLNLIPWDIYYVVFSWQTIMIVIGAVLLANGNRILGTVLFSIGIFFILPNVFKLPYNFESTYWPVILIVIGVSLLFRQKSALEKIIELNEKKTSNTYQFDDLVILGSRNICINSQELKGGKITTVLGSIEYDLRQSQLLPDKPVVVNCGCFFGGMVIKVPLDWTVKNEVTTILGSFTDGRSESFLKVDADPTKTILFKGTVFAGAIDIKFN